MSTPTRETRIPCPGTRTEVVHLGTEAFHRGAAFDAAPSAKYQFLFRTEVAVMMPGVMLVGGKFDGLLFSDFTIA